MHEAERGLFDLQQGRPLHVTPPRGHAHEVAILLATVEGLTTQTLEQLSRLYRGPIRLAVTHHRARAMGLTNGGGARDVSLRLNGQISPEHILRLSSAMGNYATKTLDVREASPSEIGGLTLARLGQAAACRRECSCGFSQCTRELRKLRESGAILVVTTAQIEAMASNARVAVVHVSDGPVPLEEAEDARFMFFREANGVLEHVVILIGNRESWPDPVPVRLHSACLTGDLFGSLRCDCGDQLREKLARVHGQRRRRPPLPGAGGAGYRSGKQAQSLRLAAEGPGHGGC